MSDASFRRHRATVSLTHAARRIRPRLSPELLGSVASLAPLFQRGRIPPDHLQELQRLHLAERRFGRLRLTALGRCLLMV